MKVFSLKAKKFLKDQNLQFIQCNENGQILLGNLDDERRAQFKSINL